MIYKFSKEMREILIELLTNNIVVTSWGITHLNISDAEISFEVDGFKYKGIVSIVASAKQLYYEVRIGERQFKDCHLQDVVKMIDKEVEYGSTYQGELEKNLML